MSTELSFAPVEASDAALVVKPKASAWLETAVAVLFAATAVLFVSFVAVMTGIL